ncbi:MAG TPA: 2-C-methyl-D-erythritol 4-phosphate cytidylyltransferase [Ruminococcus sp.]|nr:2-C-methyl-D-erythritol 4-phosphate cytidylyltransferase [Ruminococcus sp.]
MSLRCAAVVLAGGSGSRMGGNTPKQYLLLDGKPLIWYSLHAFEESPVEEVVLVVRPGETELCRRNLVEPFGFRKIRTVVEGGKERFHSVFAGLQALKGRGYDLVAIHDGARPLILPADAERVIAAARETGAASLGVPVKDTVKVVREGIICDTPPRAELYLTQTPQVFRRSLYAEAMQLAAEQGKDYTDDCQLVEALGNAVTMVTGDYSNLKLTTPEDFAIAEALLSRRTGGC